MMQDVAVASSTKSTFSQIEFYAFYALSFIGKSMLLIRLPYREVASLNHFTRF